MGLPLIEFRLLGQVEAWREGRQVELGGRKQRAVLASLLLQAGRVVSLDQLIDDLWPERPPARAAATVQVFVSNLRRALKPDRRRRDTVCAMEAVQVRRMGEVAEIVLSRPGKLNAMNMAWVSGLVDAVAAVERDKPGIVVVRGEGRAFCAGLDLDMLSAESMPDGFYALQERAFVGLERLDRLVIAQIHGYCLGGGLQLALACDIRILAEDAELGLPAAAEGLPPGMATWRLPRFVGLGRAMRLSVGGERIGAGEALAIGLADHVLPVAGFAEGAAGLVDHYLAVPQGAARATKELVRSAFDTDFATAHARSRTLVAECLAGSDVAAARAAWAARR